MSSDPTPGVAPAQSQDIARASVPAQIGDESPQSRQEEQVTPVGVDVGTKQLVTAATAADPHGGPAVDERKYIRHLYSEFCSATHRLSVAPEYDETTIADLVDRYWPLFKTTFTLAAEEVINYAQQHESSVIVLEDLQMEQQPLRACRDGRVQLPTWCPPAVQGVLAKRAVEAGLAVIYVDAHNTTRECHRCGKVGELEWDQFSCTNDDCPIDEVCRDRSAAVSIANRA